jgi:thiol-disulfide isomerase/thioredoxin
MDATFLSTKFESALPYDRYVQTGTDEQQRRWRQVYEVAKLTAGQQQLLSGFVRDMKVLVVSGIWCGDCVQQVPLLQRLAEGNAGRIDLRILDRDANRDLANLLRINGGDRVPVALFLAEDFEFCAAFGERSLHRYRSLARMQLGAACPIGLAPPDADEVAATLQDWLDEFERVQLLLRLSPRLRRKHND